MTIFTSNCLVIDIDKITFLSDIGYGYWEVHFVGGSFVRIGRQTAESICDAMKKLDIREGER